MSESNQQPHDDLIGKTLGQYTIVSQIGQGGMATVYKATQTSINRTVAVKVLPRALLHDPGFYERFTREVEVIAMLEHPHIVPIYDYGESEGMPYITMRLLAGDSLKKMVRDGWNNLSDLVRPISQVAQALDYAHQQGIIHRDLKPGNILMDENGNAYLSDFGIARVIDSKLTGSAIIGTPAYMSPEQANGSPLDSRSDLYAFGIVVYELLTGSEPFFAETPVAMLFKHINDPLPPMASFNVDVPEAVEEVVEVATAKDPDERYATATEFAEAFADAVRTGGPRRRTTVDLGNTAGVRRTGSVTPRSTGELEHQPTVTPATDPDLRADGAPTIAPPISSTDTALSRGGAQQRGNLAAILGGLLLIAVVVVGILVIAFVDLDSLTGGSAPLPTPFPRASTITQDGYSLNVPDIWIPPQLIFDVSRDGMLRHRWQSADGSVHVTVAPLEMGVDFNTTLRGYERAFFEDVDGLELIDTVTAPDGTQRTSYRVLAGHESLAPGQVDVFYLERENTMLVLELYADNDAGNDFVQTFQLILDSLRAVEDPV